MEAATRAIAISLLRMHTDTRKKTIHVTISHPRTAEGHAELSQRVAAVHADAILTRLQELTIPLSKKQDLLATLINAVHTKNREQTS